MGILLAKQIKISEQIVVGVLAASVSIITFIIGAIIESKREKRRFKQEKDMRLFEEKVIAYQKMYAALLEYKEYFELFIDGGNEYKESEDYRNFAPLVYNQKFRNCYNLYSLYLSDEMRKICLDTLESGEILNNLAIAIHNSAEFLDCVEPNCENVLSNIQMCIDQIRREFNI